ncbi:MAG: hypothetical protein P8N02_03085 [Actinomycetota bacterium]|nr:hypothetical protein [Actinomycetota bacterium]
MFKRATTRVLVATHRSFEGAAEQIALKGLTLPTRDNLVRLMYVYSEIAVWLARNPIRA